MPLTGNDVVGLEMRHRGWALFLLDVSIGRVYLLSGLSIERYLIAHAQTQPNECSALARQVIID